MHWLSLPDSQALVMRLLEDARAGRPLAGPAGRSGGLEGTVGQGQPLSPSAAGAAMGAPASPLSPKSAQALLSLAMPPLSPVKSAGSPPRSPSPRRRPARTLSGGAADAADAARRQAIPRFYFPAGKGVVSDEQRRESRERVEALFASADLGKDAGKDTAAGLPEEAFARVARELCGLPSFLGPLLFAFCTGGKGSAGYGEGGGMGDGSPVTVGMASLLDTWESKLAHLDPPARAFEVLRRGKDHVAKADFLPVLHDLVARHPGLEFLAETPEFQERYAETVIHRIFFGVNRSDTGKMTLRELVRSDLLEAMAMADDEEDINRVVRYFSYEHFYVIYCRFWELDTDHDFLLDREDLLRYGNHALTYRIVDRIFAETPRRFASGHEGKMGFEDFCHFILCEEDKSTEQSLEYWFRCVDLDGDGILLGHELRHFYEEQLHRMECLQQEAILYEDIMCQMSDMIKPAEEGTFTLRDLKRCPLSGNLFNVLGNLNKFIAFETRDPFMIRQEREDQLSEWDRFARAEYVRLSMDEEATEDGMSDGGGGGWDDGGFGAAAGAF